MPENGRVERNRRRAWPHSPKPSPPAVDRDCRPPATGRRSLIDAERDCETAHRHSRSSVDHSYHWLRPWIQRDQSWINSVHYVHYNSVVLVRPMSADVKAMMISFSNEIVWFLFHLAVTRTRPRGSTCPQICASQKKINKHNFCSYRYDMHSNVSICPTQKLFFTSQKLPWPLKCGWLRARGRLNTKPINGACASHFS